ncbi:MAG: AEC family transporter [Defluviitaleaceae bacterium]|nr:AEC family transporter [Defluviitaleaceae bacterium]
MLYNLIFSLNAVMPLFLLIALGYTLKKRDFLSGGFISGGNKFVFYIALPMTLFRNLYMSDVSELLDLTFIAFIVSASVLSFLAIWVVSAFFIKDRTIIGAFVQGAFRGNFAFLGMPLLLNIAGEAGMARATLIITFVLPLYNICSILVLAAYSDSGKKVGPLTIAFAVVKNPFIIGISVAVATVLLGIQLPSMISRSVTYISGMAIPLALICLGAGIVFQGFDKKFKFVLVASIIKVVALPVIFVAVGYAFGFRGVDLVALLVLGGTPSAIIGYTMVVQMGGDVYIAGTIVVTSTLLSAVSLTLLISFMRMLGLFV